MSINNRIGVNAPMRILIIGSGLLGSRIIEIAKNRGYAVFASYNTIMPDIEGINFIQADISKKEDVKKLFEKSIPRKVIHTAAMTNVDQCEVDKKRAWDINVEGTKYIAEFCQKYDSQMIYISTDFVFDGKKGNYRETDEPNPISYYGLTKLEGENVLSEFDIEYGIARTSVIYGNHPYRFNFVSWVINELGKGKRINVVKDQYNSPTFANNLADVLLKMHENERYGLYHASGSERINRYDFAVKIADVFELDASLINPITSDKFLQKAKRPWDSSLNVTKIQRELGVKMLNIREGLIRMKEEVNK